MQVRRIVLFSYFVSKSVPDPTASNQTLLILVTVILAAITEALYVLRSEDANLTDYFPMSNLFMVPFTSGFLRL